MNIHISKRLSFGHQEPKIVYPQAHYFVLCTAVFRLNVTMHVQNNIDQELKQALAERRWQNHLFHVNIVRDHIHIELVEEHVNYMHSWNMNINLRHY